MLFEIVRPDCIRALEDPVVRKVLRNYVRIVKNEIPARFVVCDSIKAEFKENWDETKLLELHRELMEKFRKKLKKVYEEGLKVRRVKKSLLDLKIEVAKRIMEHCEFCEWKCRVNRIKGGLGFCQVGNKMLISSEFIHMGEESYITPSHTVFFWSCNMQCAFCQNYTISYRLEKPIEINEKVLAEIVRKRREQGCRNLNLVGGEPTPYIFFILKLLKECKVSTPVVWNSNFYMSKISMEILDGIVDVYLSDFKFGPGDCSKKLTRVKNYWEVVSRNHLIASNQAELVIRHLILPNHIECCSFPILEFIAKNLKEKCILNIMDQYFPYWKAKEFPEINRRITPQEFNAVLKKARELGLYVKS